MTLLLAALLGNVLAWCVHAFSWWLREKCLWLIGFIGLFCLLCVPFIMYVSLALTGFGEPTLEEMVEIEKQFIADVWKVATGYNLLALLGCWHQRILKTNTSWQYVWSITALYAELGAAIYVYLRAEYVLRDYLGARLMMSREIGDTFLWVFFIVLLILALIRPQVVKVQKWLWQQVRPQRVTSE